MGAKENNEKRLKDLLDDSEVIADMHSTIDINKYLGSADNLPETKHIEEHDYNQEMKDSVESSSVIVNSLAQLYLSDNHDFFEKDYVKNKILEDIGDYSQNLFLNKILNRNLIIQQKQFDAGESNSLAFKAFTDTIKEMRELTKDRQKQRREIENYYKELRRDFGLKELNETAAIQQPEEEEEGGMILNGISLNNLIDEVLVDQKKKNQENTDNIPPTDETPQLKDLLEKKDDNDE